MPRRPEACAWCGREFTDTELGRRRRYCRQSCRQRAYEQRNAVKGTAIAPDSTVLTCAETAALADRTYEARCAAEDVATAIGEGAGIEELRVLSDRAVRLAREAERLR